jgi:quinol-cytochrome oxidoreductase complex cytochrome b subunit
MAEKERPGREESVPFYPDHLRQEAWVGLGLLLGILLVGVLGLFFPVGLEAPADPMNTPTDVRPEWYFLFLYQLLKHIPKTIGAVIPVLGIVLLVIWPFLDRRPRQLRLARLIRIGIAAVVLAVIVGLTIWEGMG